MKLHLVFVEDALQEGVKEACKKYGVARSTGYDLLQQWDPAVGALSLTRLRPGPEKGIPKKLTPEVKEFVTKRIQEDNTLSGFN